MKRTARVTAAAMLVFIAAGCGGQSAGSSGTTASNRTEATADAQHLLGMVRVPTGARLTDMPHLTGFDESREFIGALASATASRTWLVHSSVGQLLTYVVAHLRAGSKLQSTGIGSGPNVVDESQIRYWPPVRGVLGGRWLQLEAYSDRGRTYLTARAQSQWVVAREASERIPSNVRGITVSVVDDGGHTIHQLTVTKPRIVHRMVELYNSLGVIQPVDTSCPAELGGVVTLTFYDSHENVIATATSPADANPNWPPDVAAWACFPIKITLAQHSYPSLSGNVITPLSKLLHTRLAPRAP